MCPGEPLPGYSGGVFSPDIRAPFPGSRLTWLGQRSARLLLTSLEAWSLDFITSRPRPV